MTLIKISFSGWSNKIRGKCYRSEEGKAGEGLARVRIGKLRSFAMKRDREMGQSLEKDVGTTVFLLLLLLLF